MASSKFSRRPRIQQPPPVCRSGKIPIPPTPPPPEIDNVLKIDVTWEGYDSLNIWRELAETVTLAPAYDPDGAIYSYDRPGADPWLTIWMAIGPSGVNGYYEWGGDPGWNALANAVTEITYENPMDTGILPASETMPPGAISTFRLYTAYVAP